MALTKTTYSMISGATVNVIDFGAVGDGITDDTAALQAAFSAGKDIYLGGSDKTYLISDDIIVQSGTTVFGEQATITQTTNLTPILNIDNKSNITIRGIKFIGVGTDFVNSDANPLAVGIYTNSGSSNLCISNSEFNNFGYAGIRLKAATNAQIIDNNLVGPGSAVLTPITDGACYGVVTDTGCKNIVISGNLIKEYAQGLRIEGTEDINILNNLIVDIVGQHGMYVGSQTENITITGNTVLRVDLIGIKVQAQNTGTLNKNVTISGNTVSECGGDGIEITHGAGSTPQLVRTQNVSITGNVVSNITAYGIVVQNCVICTVNSNSVNVCGAGGIIISATDYLAISNNILLNTQTCGIRDQYPCTYVAISNNILRNVAIANQANDNFGILIQDGTVLEISGNIISDASGGMLHGIYVAGGSQPTQSIFNNQVLEASGKAIRFASSSTAMAMYKNNVLVGSTGASVNNPSIPSIASAATIVLPTAHDVVLVTGTTNISAISTEGHSGHAVTLIFNGALTVSDGASLLLSGNFVTTANDCLTLACNGSVWYEVSRSAN